MLRRTIQTLVWKYDRFFASIVALLPISLQPLSAVIGRVTLPSIWAVALTASCLIIAANGHQEVAILGVIIIACIPVGSILKLLVRRARPKTIYAQNMKIKSFSFPSSHTYAGTIAGGFFIVSSLALLPMPISILSAALFIALIVVIGISRIHVGAHYPTDVTAGWILGVGVLYFVTQIII